MTPLLAGSGVATKKFAADQPILALEPQPGESRQYDATGHNLYRRLSAQSVDDRCRAYLQANRLDTVETPGLPAELSDADKHPESA